MSRNEINQCPNAPSLLTQIINKTIDFEKTPTIELLCNELRSENPDYLRCYSDCETRFANNFSNMKQGYELKLKEASWRQEMEARKLKEQVEYAAAKKAEEQRIAELHDGLRSGKLSPQNIKQAKIAYDAGDGYELSNSPKLRPDYQLYALSGTIYEANDSVPRFIGEVRTWSKSIIPMPELNYIDVKIPSKLRDQYFNNARINSRFDLIGRYVGNSEYSSVLGTNETAAIFDAIYLDFGK